MKPDPQPLCMINDTFVDRLEVRDRGLAYGDGLFETLRFTGGRAPLLPFHLDRLLEGCARLAIPLARAQVETSFERFVSAFRNDTSAIIKLIVTRGSGGQGYSPPSAEAASPSLIWQHLPLAGTEHLARGGVELHRCQLPVYSNPSLAGLKHLSRLDYVMAAREVPGDPGVQGLLLDDKANVLEAIHHNLFFVKGNTLLTPRMGHAGVKGVMRRVILEHIAPACSISVREDDFLVESLLQADEVFLTNSVRGVWPVNAFHQVRWSVPGSVTARVQAMVDNTFAGAVAWV